MKIGAKVGKFLILDCLPRPSEFGVLIYFCSNFSKLKLMKLRKIILLIALGFSVTVLTPVLILAFLFFEWERDFDQKCWTKYPDKRYEMGRDIVESKMLIGLDSLEVNRILGTGHSSGKDLEGNVGWHYDMGLGKSLGFDVHYLHIEFQGNTVVKVDRFVARI